MVGNQEQWWQPVLFRGSLGPPWPSIHMEAFHACHWDFHWIIHGCQEQHYPSMQNVSTQIPPEKPYFKLACTVKDFHKAFHTPLDLEYVPPAPPFPLSPLYSYLTLPAPIFLPHFHIACVLQSPFSWRSLPSHCSLTSRDTPNQTQTYRIEAEYACEREHMLFIFLGLGY